MVIFLASAVPLAFALAVFGYSKHPLSLGVLGQHVARGFFALVIGFVIYLLLRPLVQLDYTTGGIYGYYLAHDNLYFLSWCVISYLVFYQIPHTDTPDAESMPTLAYFAAFYSLLAIGNILLDVKAMTAYSLFLLPLSRIGVMFVSVAALLFARRMYSVVRYGLLLVPFIASSVAAFVPTLYTLRHVTASVFLSVGLVLAGVFLFLLADRK